MTSSGHYVSAAGQRTASSPYIVELAHALRVKPMKLLEPIR